MVSCDRKRQSFEIGSQQANCPYNCQTPCLALFNELDQYPTGFTGPFGRSYNKMQPTCLPHAFVSSVYYPFALGSVSVNGYSNHCCGVSHSLLSVSLTVPSRKAAPYQTCSSTVWPCVSNSVQIDEIRFRDPEQTRIQSHS